MLEQSIFQTKVVISWLFTEVDVASVVTSTSVKSQKITTLVGTTDLDLLQVNTQIL